MNVAGLRRACLPAVVVAVMVSAHATASAETIRVTIKAFRFSPVEVAARVGDTIEWANEDFVAHTATARSGEWEVAIPRGEVGRLIVDESSGEWDYFCRFHPQMTGRVVVAD